MEKSYVLILTALLGATSLEAVTPVHNRVIDYVPAPGQFVNELPEWEEGDNATDMAEKAYLYMIPEEGMISLGAWGGYVTVGFEQTIVNVAGKRDIYIEGNALQADLSATEGGDSEPGVVMVAYDVNGNGEPDETEWFEIAGSEYRQSVRDYRITYKRPDTEDLLPLSEMGKQLPYIEWSDNKGNAGYVYANEFHSQPYWPMWLADKEELVFEGTRLPDNGVDESGDGSYYVLRRFDWGYADNWPNVDPVTQERLNGAYIDIDWAIGKDGNKVKMPGVDFVRIYTGVNQANGWLGECSTEVCRIMNAHTKKVGREEVVDESVKMDEKVLAEFLAQYGNGSAVIYPVDNSNVVVYVDRSGLLSFTLNRKAVVRIYDQSGRQIYFGEKPEGRNEMDLSSCPAGLYVVEVDGCITKILKK